MYQCNVFASLQFDSIVIIYPACSRTGGSAAGNRTAFHIETAFSNRSIDGRSHAACSSGFVCIRSGRRVHLAGSGVVGQRNCSGIDFHGSYARAVGRYLSGGICTVNKFERIARFHSLRRTSSSGHLKTAAHSIQTAVQYVQRVADIIFANRITVGISQVVGGSGKRTIWFQGRAAAQISSHTFTDIADYILGGVKLATVNRIGGSSRNFARPYLFDLTVANGHRTIGGIADICIVQSVYIFRSRLVGSSNGSRT